MLKPQPYYYEDLFFQLELNLQATRRDLIRFLEEYPDEDCYDCNRLKCCCIEKQFKKICIVHDSCKCVKNFALTTNDTIFKQTIDKQDINHLNFHSNQTQQKIVNKDKLILTYNNLEKNNNDKNVNLNTATIATQILLNKMFEAAKTNPVLHYEYLNNNTNTVSSNIDTAFDTSIDIDSFKPINQYDDLDFNNTSPAVNTAFDRYIDIDSFKPTNQYADLDFNNMISPAANTLPNPDWNLRSVKCKVDQIEDGFTINAWAQELPEIDQTVNKTASKILLDQINYTWPPFPQSIWSYEKASCYNKETQCSHKSNDTVEAFFRHFQSKSDGK